MKTIKTIWLLFVATIVCLATQSCSDDKDEPIEPVNVTESDIVGAWSDNDVNSPEFFVFEDDGTGEYITTDEDGEFESKRILTWSVNNGTLTLKSGGVTEKEKIVKCTSRMIQFEDSWALYRIDMSDIPSEGSSANPAFAPYVGTWNGSDSSDVVVAQFGADGSYTDWLIINGRRTEEQKGRYEVSGSTVTIPSNSNLNNLWGRTYTVKFNNSKKMTWTNALMNDWHETWVFEK